MTLAVEHPLS